LVIRFRAFAVIVRGHCQFISRKKFKLYGLRDLAAALAREVTVETAILDGELAVPDHLGRTVFAAMMKRRYEARFFGFDLASLNGEDLCQLPLLTRKLPKILVYHLPTMLKGAMIVVKKL
jgi:ATP-dependent DNA ligase